MTDSQVKNFGPYTPIRRAGNLYFISGQVGVDFADKTTENDVAYQTNRAIDNMMMVLDTAKLSLDDVVKTTVFVTDMDNAGLVNEVYTKRFANPRPARSMVAVKELPRVVPGSDLLIEIEAIACREEV